MRLVTRSDFDGLACAVLLKELGMIDDYLFAHPKDLQDGRVEVGPNDILANVPYVPGVGLWFDHHSSERERVGDIEYQGRSEPAPSCARVIWNHYGPDRFPARLAPMMDAVDRVDSADLTEEDIVAPKGWILLGLIMDPRTGLGRFRDYRISNYQLMLDMIGHCRSMTDEEILQLPDVRERVLRYQEQNEKFKSMLTRCARAEGNCIVVDLRDQDVIYAGNRFLVYTMFPECTVSIQIIWGFKKQNTVFTVGKSILNRGLKADVGAIMLRFGGGGHQAVGACQVPHDQAENVLRQLVDLLSE